MRSTVQRLMAKVVFGVVKLGTVTRCTAVTQLSDICLHTKSELLLYPELLCTLCISFLVVL